jgi:alpha-amylase
MINFIIFLMNLFIRNVAGTETVKNWWDNGKNQIAFSRGNKGYLTLYFLTKVLLRLF